MPHFINRKSQFFDQSHWDEWRIQLGYYRPQCAHCSEMLCVHSPKGTGKSLLPGEGKVGTYKELIDSGTRGDNITPHHMPSKAYMEKNAGVHKNDGVCMNMEHPYPGTGGRHRQTETYGMSGQNVKDYLNLSPRDALARDIWNARKIYQNDGLYTSEIRKGLQNVINLNNGMYPELFKKK